MADRQGRVENVWLAPAGTRLIANAASAATVLNVQSADNFSGLGGQLKIAGNIYTYISKDSVEIPGAVEGYTDTLTLSSGLLASASADDEVLVEPLAPQMWAIVSFSDDNASDGSVIARIPHTLQGWFPVEGIRAYADRENVTLDLMGNEWVVQDVYGKTSEISGSSLVPGSIPEEVFSDGNPPASSPTPQVIGGVGVLHVRWDGISNADSVTYEVHLSTTDNFTASASTLADETGATSTTLRSLPPADTPLEPGSEISPTVYYVRIIAKDADGAAAASTDVPGSLYFVGSEVISANYVYGGNIIADQIIGGTISSDLLMSGTIRTAESGQRVEIDSNGLKQFGSDGASVTMDLPNSGVSKFTGTVDAQTITIQDRLDLRGINNYMARGAKLTVQSVNDSPVTPAQLSVGYLDSEFSFGYAGNDVTGAHVNPGGTSKFFTYRDYFNTSGVFENANYYSYPRIPNSEGNTASSYIFESSQKIQTNVFGALVFKTVATNPYPEAHLKCFNVSTLNSSGTVAPTELATFNLNEFFNWYVNWTVGRCIGDISRGGSTNLNTQFVTCRAQDSFPDANISFTFQFQIRQYNSGAGTITNVGSTVNPSAVNKLSSKEKILGVTYGDSLAMDFHGSAINIYVVHTTHRNLVFNTSGVRQTDLEFPPITGLAERCRVFTSGDLTNNDFLNFQGITQPSVVSAPKEYSNISWTGNGTSSDANAVWWVSYRWRNSTSVTLKETLNGAVAQVLMKKRGNLVVTTPNIPPPADGVTRDANEDIWTFRYFLGKGTTQPANTAIWLQTLQPANLETTITLKTNPVTAGTAASSAPNLFATTTPAEILSSEMSGANPKLRLRGDGVIRGMDIEAETSLKVQGNDARPVGEITMWPTATAPTNWLICNAQAVSRTTYAALFTLIGTTYGAGDGSTTFNVPDLRSRFPVGVGTFAALAGTEGQAENARSSNHTHGVLNHTHTDTYAATTGTIAHNGGTVQPGTGTAVNRVGAIDGSQNGTHNHTVSITGGVSSSGAHTSEDGDKTGANHTVPFIAINFIIRAK